LFSTPKKIPNPKTGFLQLKSKNSTVELFTMKYAVTVLKYKSYTTYLWAVIIIIYFSR